MWPTGPNPLYHRDDLVDRPRAMGIHRSADGAHDHGGVDLELGALSEVLLFLEREQLQGGGVLVRETLSVCGTNPSLSLAPGGSRVFLEREQLKEEREGCSLETPHPKPLTWSSL